MTLENLDKALQGELEHLNKEGRAKQPERIITGYISATGVHGPRYRLAGQEKEFIRLNSNSYLSLSNHPALIKAADSATHSCGPESAEGFSRRTHEKRHKTQAHTMTLFK